MRLPQPALAMALLLVVACAGSQPVPLAHVPGPLGDTWVWSGGTWHRAGVGGPAARYHAAMAYDAARGRFVMFAGQTKSGTSDETWTWDGSRWQLQSSAHKPPPRRSAAMAYDPATHLVLLFGGLIPDQAEGQDAGDTWGWDGTDWTELDKGPGPAGRREGPQMVTAGGGAVLFGGRFYNTEYFGDARRWSGTTWVSSDDGTRPAGRAGAALTWDASDSSLFVYGGSALNSAGGPGAQGVPQADAWSLSGSTWTRLQGSGPPALEFADAIWDGAHHRDIVLLGMACPNPIADAWAWDGRGWSKLSNQRIPARWGAALAQAPDGRALLFGGSDESGC